MKTTPKTTRASRTKRAFVEYRGVIIFRNPPGYALPYYFRIEGAGNYASDTLRGAKEIIRDVMDKRLNKV